MVQYEFVNYFDFAECFAELLDCGNIEQLPPNPDADGDKKDKELYRITPNGITIAEQLQSSILNMIKEKSLKSAMRMLSFKSRGSDVSCYYTEREDGRYDLRCVVSENGNKILDLGLIIESKYQLDKMVYNFNERTELVYRWIISLITGDINYLIE